MALSRTEIASRVETLVRDRLRLPATDSLDETTGLLGQGIGLDSIEVLQLVAGAEASFDITVSDDELLPEHFETVGTFVTALGTVLFIALVPAGKFGIDELKLLATMLPGLAIGLGLSNRARPFLDKSWLRPAIQ